MPTRLYGRESFEYEMFEFTAREMLNANSTFINNFFDNCFYRYRNEILSPGAVNLKRLFFEILSGMLKALKSRYISEEEVARIERLIDVLFDNNIMLYTDPNRFVRNISGLQSSINETQQAGFVTVINNRLFSRMKDKAIQFHGIRKREVSGRYIAGRNKILEFMTWATNYGEPGEEALEYMIRQLGRIGLINAGLYLYPQPVDTGEGAAGVLPETIRLRCVIRDGELYMIAPEKQECPVAEIYDRSELPAERQGYISYPLFCGRYLFGMLVCGVDGRLFEIGEFLTFQLSRAIQMNWAAPRTVK